MLDTKNAAMMMKMAEMEALRKRLLLLLTAAVVSVMPTRLVFKIRSLEPGSGSRLCRHFVRQKAVALEVIKDVSCCLFL